MRAAGTSDGAEAALDPRLLAIGPLVVAGMHRSGTSLTASWVESLGVNLGDRLLAADAHNARGYFEDAEFLTFQRQALQACCPPGDPGWPDWGWTESERLDRDRLAAYRPQAEALLAARVRQASPQENRAASPAETPLWGWKDPRTTLMLDFWHDLLPGARYLLVYRWPWDVADSILRIGHPLFVGRPDYALRAWVYYNRHLLDFYRQHRDRCWLGRIDALTAAPETLAAGLRNKLGLPLAAAGSGDGAAARAAARFDPALFRALGPDHPLAIALMQAAPAAASLLADLEREADLAGPIATPDAPPTAREASPWDNLPPDPPPEYAPLALHHRAIAAEGQRRHQVAVLQQQQADARARADRCEAELAALKASRLWRWGQALRQALRR